MLESYQLKINYKPQQRQVLHTLLALITGVLALVYPNLLYLIAGGYLIILGALFMAFRIPAFISAIPLVAGIIIFIFPELIPVTFALFLGLFGFMLLFAFQFTLIGAITLIIAVLIFMNPGSIAYLIAIFLLLYGVSSVIRLYYQSKQLG